VGRSESCGRSTGAGGPWVGALEALNRSQCHEGGASSWSQAPACSPMKRAQGGPADMLHAGLDLTPIGLITAFSTATARGSRRLRRRPTPTRWPGWWSAVTVRGGVCAAIESMNGARFVHDTLERCGWDVQIADAHKVNGARAGTASRPAPPGRRSRAHAPHRPPGFAHSPLILATDRRRTPRRYRRGTTTGAKFARRLPMTGVRPILRRDRVAALAGRRVIFAEHIEVVEPDHPERRWVAALCLYSHAVDTRQVRCGYVQADADERRAIAADATRGLRRERVAARRRARRAVRGSLDQVPLRRCERAEPRQPR
jgi:hypothetical protein